MAQKVVGPGEIPHPFPTIFPTYIGGYGVQKIDAKDARNAFFGTAILSVGIKIVNACNILSNENSLRSQSNGMSCHPGIYPRLTCTDAVCLKRRFRHMGVFS